MTAFYDPVKKIWSGHDTLSVYNPNQGLGELILYALSRNPEKITQISDDYQTKMTCEEMKLKSIRVSQNLKQHGIKFGDITALVSGNHPDVAPVVFGCLLAGAPLNTLDTEFDRDDITHMFNLTKPKAIFCETVAFDSVKYAIDKLRLNSLVFLFDTKNKQNQKFLGDNSHYVSCLFKPVDCENKFIPQTTPDTYKHIAFIVCSSGTTGLCKGVCLSHAQIIAQTLRIWPGHNQDVTFAASSLYWLSGISTLCIGTVEGSTRVITTESFSPDLFFKLVKRHQITNCFMPPSQAALCLESEHLAKVDLTSIRTVTLAGSMVLDDIRMRLQQKINKQGKVYVAYGLTESATTSTINYKYHKANCVGPPKSQNLLKIIDEDGNSLGPGKVGEICTYPPIPFFGYYANDKKNREICDEEGWIHSGDIGYFDDDGELFVVGRKKEIIKYQNYQISPASIEALLQQKTGIMRICAVGVEDVEHGTDLPAVMIVRPYSCPLSEQEIIKIANESLTGVKQLRGGIYFLDKFPMTPSGKIQRRKLKEKASELYHARNKN